MGDWRRVAGLAVVVAVAAAAVFLATRSETPPEWLVLYGNVDIRQVNLAFNVEGRLAAVAVEEGDRVTTGQALATLDKGYHEDAVKVARARLDAQKATVAKLEAGSRPEEIALARAEVERAQAAVTHAQATFERQSELVRRSVASQQAYDDARDNLTQAEARLKAVRESLALAVAGPRKEDIAAARAQLRADEATVSLAERRLGDTELKAPAEGVILTRVQEPGAVLGSSTTVLTLALTRPVWVRAYVSEPDLGRIHNGMPAEVVSDSAPGKAYRGQVGFISPVAEFTPKTVETPDLRTSLVYRLRVIVDAPDDGLRQGMPVTVTLRPRVGG